MNDFHFLLTGDNIPDENKMDKYFKDYNTFDLSCIAVKIIENMGDNIAIDSIKEKFNIDYAILLKIVLLKLETKENFIKMLIDMLYDFMKTKIGVVFGRECHIAISYFLGYLEGFISVKCNSNFIKVQKKLMASAWDIHLFRFPELTLTLGDSDECIIMMKINGIVVKRKNLEHD